MTTTGPTTPGVARKRLTDAKRHLFARIIASAHLLDKPFTNAPDQSPWSRMKHAMEGLDAAITALDAAPTVYALPPEPPGPLWYPDGTKLVRIPPPPGYTTHTWARAATGTWSSGLTWRELLGAAAYPLSTIPPAGTTTTEETA